MMPDRNAIKPELRCYRCGSSLESLSLPLARLDLCPACGVELHVCRMCTHYALAKPDACDEEDAVPVHNKATANFCDWFALNYFAFSGREQQAESEARQKLSALFGADVTGGTAATSTAPAAAATPAARDSLLDAAEKLFRK